MPKTPRQFTSNPNERELNEPDEEDKRRQKLREEVIKRFKTRVQEEIETPQGADKRPARSKRTSANPRADTDSDSSASVRVTGRTTASKARPKAKTTAWRRRSDNSDTAEPPASEPASASNDPKKSSNKHPTVRRPVRQETSERAKEMLADADVARRVYERMQRNLVQDFANIQWYSRPECAETPRYGYCLSCRQTSEACN